MNHIAINSSIWNSNSQSLSDFEIYRSIFYFCGQTNPVSTKCRLQTGCKMQTRYKMQTEDWVGNAD